MGEKTTWMIQELLSNRELMTGGRGMHHCMVSYAKNCRKGNTSIWSLQAVDGGDQKRQSVMTIAVDVRRPGDSCAGAGFSKTSRC